MLRSHDKSSVFLAPDYIYMPHLCRHKILIKNSFIRRRYSSIVILYVCHLGKVVGEATDCLDSNSKNFDFMRANDN